MKCLQSGPALCALRFREGQNRIANISEIKSDQKKITTQQNLRKCFYINFGGQK